MAKSSKSTQRVLVGCMTSDLHKQHILKFCESLRTFDYKHADFIFVDNSANDAHAELIREQGFEVRKNPNSKGSKAENLLESRRILVDRAINEGYDYLLFIDADIIAPKDVITRLLSHKKDIISGVYLSPIPLGGKIKLCPMVFGVTKDPDAGGVIPINMVFGSKIFEISGAGFGCFLVKTPVLKKIGLRTNAAGSGEGMLFCSDARKQGYKVFVDTSVKCLHIVKNKVLKVPNSLKEIPE